MLVNKKRRVLQVNKFYSPHIGGVEKVVQDIAEGLSNLARIDVLACRSKGRFQQNQINGVNVIKANSLGVCFSMPFSPQFPFLLREICHDYDVIHFHMPFPLGDLSCLLSGYKGKVIASWHSDVVRQKKLLQFYKPLLHKFLDRVDQIIVATPNHIESSAFLKQYREKCVVIPYGIDLGIFQLNESISGKVKIIKRQHSKPIVLFVGRLIYYKGLEYLIDAMLGIEADLVIIGQGPLLGNLEKRVHSYEMQDRVFFMGHSSFDDIVSFYHACDIFVLPSIANSEAFGLVQLEAMACGKPIINTLLPTGVPYVSVHNETGLSVPPKDTEALRDAIVKLISNKTLRVEMGQNARERVESHFTKEKMLDQIFKLY